MMRMSGCSTSQQSPSLTSSESDMSQLGSFSKCAQVPKAGCRAYVSQDIGIAI